MNKVTKRQVDCVLAKRDPLVFAKLVCDFGLDPWQEDVLVWVHKRIILNCCRQSGKSTIAAVKALYLAISLPEQLIIIVSPSERQSGELFRKIRGFLRLMPPELKPKLLEDNVLSCTMENGSRIVALPGKEKTVRSFSGATLIIVDEAARVEDALYLTVRPMLAVSNGSLMLLSTMFGKRGFYYKTWAAQNKDTWKKVLITAEQCPRISKEFLKEELGEMGLWWYNQEYMGIAMDDIDSVFSHDLIMSAMDSDIEPLFAEVV